MQNFEINKLPVDVQKQIDAILKKHEHSTKPKPQKSVESENTLNRESSANEYTTLIDREIKLDPSKIIMSKTDARGALEYANEYFMEICGYEEYELMGQPHSVIRHPDMPKVVFKLLWERLGKGENIHALVKNLAKDGRYYWVLTNFETKHNEEGKIISHYAHRKAAPGNAIYHIEKLYRTLLAIEKNQSPKAAEKYFYGLLEEKGQSYDEFIFELLDTTQEGIQKYFFGETQQEVPQASVNKKGFFKKMFGK